MQVIWSLGQVYPDYNHRPNSGIEARTAMNDMFYKPDEIKYHGSVNRGAATLNFFGKKERERKWVAVFTLTDVLTVNIYSTIVIITLYFWCHKVSISSPLTSLLKLLSQHSPMYMYLHEQ